MAEKDTQVRVPNYEIEFYALIDFVVCDWQIAYRQKDLPLKPGLYAIYNKVTQECLYIGHSLCIRKRIRNNHEAIRQARKLQLEIYIAYKLIDCGSVKDTLEEIAFSEYLLIGLLRPQWNTAARRFILQATSLS